MQIEAEKGSDKLEKGQLWKIENDYIYITELGPRLVYYKLLRHPNQRAATTRMIRIEALAVYLKEHEAELVGVDPVQA